MNEWDAAASGWDEDQTTRAYAAAAFESLTPRLADADIHLVGARVLDFGCGTGLLTEHLVAAGAAVDAVDTSTAMQGVLGAKIERFGWTEVRSSDELPPAAADHDLVVCSSVCGFVPDYPSTVRDLVARLRPGGLFVQWDWERDPDDPDDHGLTRSEIRDALVGAGLVDITVEVGFELVAEGESMRPLMGHGRAAGV